MRVEENDPAFGTLLVVSRRNLLTLLAKLDGNPPASYCTIGAPVGYGKFHIKAEEDDVHYNHPNRLEIVGDSRPGPMHPATETVLAPGMTDLMVTPESIDAALAMDGCVCPGPDTCAGPPCVSAPRQRWDCLSCQTMNRADATFCSNCGEPRGWIGYR